MVKPPDDFDTHRSNDRLHATRMSSGIDRLPNTNVNASSSMYHDRLTLQPRFTSSDRASSVGTSSIHWIGSLGSRTSPVEPRVRSNSSFVPVSDEKIDTRISLMLFDDLSVNQHADPSFEHDLVAQALASVMKSPRSPSVAVDSRDVNRNTNRATVNELTNQSLLERSVTYPNERPTRMVIDHPLVADAFGPSLEHVSSNKVIR